MRRTVLLKICLLSLLMPLAFGCKDDKPKNDGPAVVTTFYLIRHAEKDRSDTTDPDPELSQDGLGRAMHWAEIFDPVPLDAIYTTNYERTSMTAAPTSVKKDITVQFYDPATLDMDVFLQDNMGKNVLVVGHSDTTPALANKLLGEEKYAAMDDYDNSSLYIIRIIDGKATDIQLKMN